MLTVNVIYKNPMKYCKICLDPNTRPNTKFNKDGVCFACENFNKEIKYYDEIDKQIVLDKLIKKHCLKNKNSFDCIIGVSGGKDSTRQALWVRDKLHLNPLLVCCTYPPEQITKNGADNLSNLINLGFDVLVTGPSPITWKKLLKESFVQGNYLRAPELALYSSLPQIAIRYNIELVFWGESPAISWNDTKTLKNEPYDGNALRNSNTLKNCDLNWMNGIIDNEYKKIPYRYPTEKEFTENNIQIIFLSWFWNNWSLVNNAKEAIVNGLVGRKDGASKTGDLYGVSAIDDDWVTLNQMIKYYKFGFGRVTDYLNFEIRSGKISRQDAIKIVKKYDGACHPKYIKNFCEYIEISTDSFWNEISKIVNRKIFSLSNKKHKRYAPKFKVGVGL